MKDWLLVGCYPSALLLSLPPRRDLAGTPPFSCSCFEKLIHNLVEIAALVASMRLVGLTGGIACGKSTASALLHEAGLPVIDCDLIARQAVRKGSWGYARVLRAFGQEVLAESGEIDREALGNIVFNNPAARRQLNAATHLPVLCSLLHQLLGYWAVCAPVVIVDMPLLFETGFYRVCYPNVLIASDPEVQRARLMQRDKLQQAAADARIASQMPLERKRALAHVVINNNGTREELAGAVQMLAASLRRGAWLHKWVLSPAGAGAALAAAGWFLLGR